MALFKKQVKSTKTSPETTASKTPGNSNLTSVICSDTVIEGKITSDANIRLDGKLVGEIDCQSRIVIGQQGRIEGKMKTANTAIEGGFDGDIEVVESISLSSTARVKGTVVARNLSVEPGAKLDGSYSVKGS